MKPRTKFLIYGVIIIWISLIFLYIFLYVDSMIMARIVSALGWSMVGVTLADFITNHD